MRHFPVQGVACSTSLQSGGTAFCLYMSAPDFLFLECCQAIIRDPCFMLDDRLQTSMLQTIFGWCTWHLALCPEGGLLGSQILWDQI